MTQQILPIHPVQAQAHGFKRPDNFSFVSQLPALAVQLSEVTAMVATLPMAFAKLADGKFALVAVTGFADGSNLLVDDSGRWGGLHLPNYLRVYPFSLQATAAQKDGENSFAVCFDHASGLYREAPNPEAGEFHFFDDQGQPQALFRQITEQLRQNVMQQHHTQRAVDALAAAKLLTPWQIKAPDGQAQQLLPKGLFRVDEEKLNQLKGEALQALHQVHALALAYGQMLSMSRVVVLQRLRESHAARAKVKPQPQPQPQPQPADPAIVQQLFGGGLGDTMKFNF